MPIARFTRLLPTLACLLLLTAPPAAAQSTDVAGVVRDPQQAVVTGARVSLLSATGTTLATTVSDGQGHYTIAVTTPGAQVLEVRADGFQVMRRPLTAAPGTRTTIDVVLSVAGTTESVTVTGSGRVEQGYRVDAVSPLGPLGGAPILDTPYTVNVLPSDLIENAQVKNFKEASKFLPLVEFQEMQGSEILRPATRGMQGSNMQNSRMDGMGIVVTGANSMESLQQIEVLNGLGGALYGPANPSGMFNFVPKRPTEQPVRNVTLSYDGQSIGTVHGDVGGRLGKSQRFGYRGNALFGGGEASVAGSDLKRRLASLAIDGRPFGSTTIEGFFSYYNVEQRGFPGWFTYGRPNNRAAFIQLPPEAPEPTEPGFAQGSAGLDLQSRIAQVRGRHQFGSRWRLSGGVLNQITERDISTQVHALTTNAGNYNASLAVGFAPRFEVTSDVATLNGAFDTGSIRHDVAIGSAGYRFQTYSDFANPPAASVFLGSASIAAPVRFALPAAGIPSHDNLFLSSAIHQQGFSLADTIGVSARWSVRVSASQDWIWTDNYNNANVRTGGYKTNGVSPLGSVLYKPAANMTAYVTYGSSLQQGDVAPGTAANPGQALPPYRTRQAEAGYKLRVAQVSVAAAVFRLDRPFANTDLADNVFKISGNQINTGFEVSLSGRVAQRLVLSGGLTTIDTNVTKTGNPATDNKDFVGIPAFKSSVLAEYQLPVRDALFVSANWQAVGRRPIDDINSTWTPRYQVVDLGVRYGRAILGRTTTWRLTVNNVSDVHYWSTLGPGNITGTNVGSYTAHFGSPRTVSASMTVGL